MLAMPALYDKPLKIAKSLSVIVRQGGPVFEAFSSNRAYRLFLRFYMP
jgi:hypothetical protein